MGAVSGQDRRFVRFTGPSLEAPAAVALTLDNLPAMGGGWKPYAYASVGLLLLAGVSYPWVRRRRAALPVPVSGCAAVRNAGPAGPTELALRKVELVAALAELESRHEAGRIPEKEYRRLRQEKRKALREVLAQHGEASGAAAATPTT
jgi:hypothetical protein